MLNILAARARRIVLLTLAWGACSALWAATIEQNSGPQIVGALTGLGQTFVWPVAAPLGSVAVVSNNTAPHTLRLYNGAHDCNNSGGETYTQAGNALTAGVLTVITLTTPQPLANGGTFTFCLFRNGGGTTEVAYSGGVNPYAAGSLVTDTFIDLFGGSEDLRFQLDAFVAAVASPVAVPLLGDYALVALILAMAAIGATVLRKRPLR